MPMMDIAMHDYTKRKKALPEAMPSIDMIQL
jgi:hypothetical protein